MGHDVNAVLLATLAVNALRRARRAGCDPAGQADPADQAHQAHQAMVDHGHGEFVTGLLLRISLDGQEGLRGNGDFLDVAESFPFEQVVEPVAA